MSIKCIDKNGNSASRNYAVELITLVLEYEDIPLLQVSPMRETYCQKVDRKFLEKLNKQKPKTIEEIQKLWYDGDMNEVYHHYSWTRYRACNLHSFFANGSWKMRVCNSTLHAGVIRSYVTLALAISNAALTKKILFSAYF